MARATVTLGLSYPITLDVMGDATTQDEFEEWILEHREDWEDQVLEAVKVKLFEDLELDEEEEEEEDGEVESDDEPPQSN